MANTFTLQHLDTLSDAELRKEIKATREITLDFKREYIKYATKLSPHDQLVMEARITQRMAAAILFTHLDFQVYDAERVGV